MTSESKVEHLIVEQTFQEPLTDDQYSTGSRRLDACLGNHGARWLRSYLSTDRRRLICEFEAPDAEAVRLSFRSAGIEFVRVWAAEVYALETAQPAT
ncbi:MAG: nickel-binding protein [bacterium]